jgi:hypothetical protein
VKQLSHSIQTAQIIIISRTGEGIGYTVPVDLVLFLLWFLSSTTAQVMALVGMAGLYRLRQGWQWLTDWPAWGLGWAVVVEDFRGLLRVTRLGFV